MYIQKIMASVLISTLLITFNLPILALADTVIVEGDSSYVPNGFVDIIDDIGILSEVAQLVQSGSNLIFTDAQQTTIDEFLLDMSKTFYGTFGIDVNSYYNVLFGSTTSEVPFSVPYNYNGEHVRAIVRQFDTIQDVESPSYSVSEEDRALASMILNYGLYVQTYGNSMNLVPNGNFMFGTIGLNQPTCNNTTLTYRLYYNTVRQQWYLYYFENNTWNLYTHMMLRGTDYYNISSLNFGLPKIYGTVNVWHNSDTDISWSLQYPNNNLHQGLMTYAGICNGMPVYVGDNFADALPIIPEVVASPSVAIGQGTYITGTNVPVEYKFPVGSPQVYFNWQQLKAILENALNNHQVVKWEDIEDVFVDVNGQKVVTTLQVVRSDYDNLVSEQYPIFPVWNVTESVKSVVAFANESTDLVTIPTSVIPDDLMFAFSGLGIILLFAFALKRSLE